jgi:WD40 repeat protein
MSYNNGGRGNRNNFGSRGKGGGRGRGRGRSGGPRPDSEICRRFIEDKCDFGKPNGKPCRFPHFIKKIGETSGHNGPIKDVLMWSSRQQLFTCSQDSTIKLWDCGSWNELTTINVQDHGTSVLGGGSQQEKSSEGVSSMVMEGPFLFVGFEGKFPLNPKIHVGMIRGWNLENPQQPPYEFRLNDTTSFAHTQSVLSLSCAVDSTGNATLFSGSADGSIRYWQMDTTTNQFKFKGILEGHIRGITRLKTAILGTTPM